MQCDDEMCGHITRNITLQRVGDAEKGTVCPLYPRCSGRLHRQVHTPPVIYLWLHLAHAMCKELLFLLVIEFLSKSARTLRVQYTEAQLYKQLTHFYRLLDASRLLEKVL